MINLYCYNTLQFKNILIINLFIILYKPGIKLLFSSSSIIASLDFSKEVVMKPRYSKNDEESCPTRIRYRYTPIRVSKKYRAINIYFFEKKGPIRVGYVPIRVSEKYREINIYFFEKKMTNTCRMRLTYTSTPILLSYVFSFKKKKKKIIKNKTTSLAALSKTLSLLTQKNRVCRHHIAIAIPSSNHYNRLNSTLFLFSLMLCFFCSSL